MFPRQLLNFAGNFKIRTSSELNSTLSVYCHPIKSSALNSTLSRLLTLYRGPVVVLSRFFANHAT